MKNNAVVNYLHDVLRDTKGERYVKIMYYFIPEFITALVLYSLPFWLESFFISQESTPAYATLGTINTLLHLLLKVAEAFSVGTVIVAGHYNGMHSYKDVGRTLRDSFWMTCLVGGVVALVLIAGAPWIYQWYGVSPEMVRLGVPFLRLCALGIFFTFIYFAFIGFLRGIKNTRTPMQFFVFGAVIFIFFDYSLIFGKFGFPKLGLQGAAWASVIQYGSMCVLAFFYVLINKKYHKYGIELLSVFKDKSYIYDLIQLSWPVILDKASLAMAYIWLCKMINPMGINVTASFCIIKDLERFAFLPAIALAQIITFLVSNDYGVERWESIEANLKKILFLASLFVFSILLTISLWSEYIVTFFDKKGEFGSLAAYSFPILSVLAFFDLLQLILSGGLRGAGNVKTVMMVRLIVCFCYFFPVSYAISSLPIANDTVKFIVLYSSFYIGNALMSVFYIYRFHGNAWKTKSL